MFYVIGLSMLFIPISLKATPSEIIGTWDHRGFACGANYRPVHEIKTRLESKRKVFGSDNTYNTTGIIPGALICNIKATGFYTEENSVLNIKIVNSTADCDQDKNFPVSMSKLLEEVILPKSKEKHISQEFNLVGDTLYLVLSSQIPPRQYPLLSPSPEGDAITFQVPATNIAPPPSCKKDEKVYEVFFRVK